MKILFFGQITKLWGLRGKPTPSTIVRCSYLARELDRLGFSCKVLFRKTRDFSRMLQEIRKSEVVVFHRLQFPLTNVPEAPIEPFLHLAGRTANKTTVFDFDDAIFLQHPLLTEFFSREKRHSYRWKPPTRRLRPEMEQKGCLNSVTCPDGDL